MFSHQEIIDRIEAVAKQRGIAASTLCKYAGVGGDKHKRLKSGRSITIKTLNKLNAFLDEDPTQ